MKIYREYLKMNTQKRIDFVNITWEVKKIIEESGIKNGIVLVNPMHITASVFINDNESGLIKDFEEWLEKIGTDPAVSEGFKIIYRLHKSGWFLKKKH